MRLYYTPWLFRKFYPKEVIWQIPTKKKILYLTFDDGPTTEVTNWILSILDEYNAKATFFCVGENVAKYPEICSELIDKSHAIGNHTYNHRNGWKTGIVDYAENTAKAKSLIKSNLFRPPYGKIKRSQARLLNNLGYDIILWTVLTYDFDKNPDKNEAWEKIVKYSKPGSILVFHDHLKAFENLKELLPKTLAYFASLGYKFEKIPLNW